MPDQRILFSKTDTARFISHLDLMRTFQRAFLRAGVTIRHTEGFNPHAFVSVLLPLSVGYSSGCELLEFGLPADGPTKEELPGILNAVLPAGITVHRCWDVARPVRELMYVDYVITLEYQNGAPVGAVNALRSLVDRESLVVTKKSKKAKSGQVEVDIIPLIMRVCLASERDTITVNALLRAQNPGMNPELLLTAFRTVYPEFTPDYVTIYRRAVLDSKLEPFT